MSARDRLQRAFDEGFDLRPEPGLRHRAVSYAVAGGRAERAPRAWGYALAGALALLVVGLLLGPRLFHQAATAPAGRPTPSAVPTASAPPPPGPSPQLFRGAMAYDPGLKRAVLFGATAPSEANGQTWTWDGSHWSQVAGAQPPARALGAAAYDGHGVVLFGGQGACPANGQGPCPTLGDTWTFDGRSWTQAHPAMGPAPTVGALMTWDPDLGKAVLIAEEPAGVQTWTWDGAAWAQLRPAHAPTNVFGAALGYDPASRHVVLYGGIVRLGNSAPPATWTFNGQDWSSAAAAPGVRQFPALADDGTHLCLFGGADANGQALGDTWEWQGSGWQRLTPAHQPPARQEARMASGQGIVTLYGGASVENQTNQATLADTWIYDGRDWTQKAG